MKYRVKASGGVGEKAWNNTIVTNDLNGLIKQAKEENAIIDSIEEVKPEFETVFVVAIKERSYNDFLYVCKTKEIAEKKKAEYINLWDGNFEIVIYIYEEMLYA